MSKPQKPKGLHWEDQVWITIKPNGWRWGRNTISARRCFLLDLMWEDAFSREYFFFNPVGGYRYINNWNISAVVKVDGCNTSRVSLWQWRIPPRGVRDPHVQKNQRHSVIVHCRCICFHKKTSSTKCCNSLHEDKSIFQLRGLKHG